SQAFHRNLPERDSLPPTISGALRSGDFSPTSHSAGHAGYGQYSLRLMPARPAVAALSRAGTGATMRSPSMTGNPNSIMPGATAAHYVSTSVPKAPSYLQGIDEVNLNNQEPAGFDRSGKPMEWEYEHTQRGTLIIAAVLAVLLV